MTRSTGMILRLLGGLIEVVCVAMILSHPSQGRRFAGVRVLDLLYAGFVLGVLVWAAGLAIVRRSSSAAHPPRD